MADNEKLQSDPKTPQKPNDPKKPKKQKAEKYSRDKYGLFPKRRSGIRLTKEEVREIKEGRKKLRAELRKIGEKSRKEFEITASSLGLYFDKNKFWSLLHWFFATKAGWIMLAAAAALLLALYAISVITQLRGHFTVSMSDKMFKEGFTISEEETFKIPTSHLFSTPAVDVPCISIVDIPEDVDDQGAHTGNYFAYTFYLKNEGESIADYQWELRINSESNSVSRAAWIMVFVDGEMTLYAKPKDNGEPEALPERGNDTVGYLKAPLYDSAVDKEGQYEIIKQYNTLTYWRVVTKPFEGESLIASGERLDVVPDEVHKYTVVVWLEGDDPDCTSELIGGHLGLEMYMVMIDEELEE